MTQISTGGPYIAREVVESAMKIKDSLITELFSRIGKLEGKVAELEARQNKRYVCADGEVVGALTEEPRLKVDAMNGKLVPWSDELEQFFEPWSKLGLDSRIPVDPGEGYEFLPHGAMREPDDGAEFWQMVNGEGKWVRSGNKGKIGTPSKHLGPYRRKIKPIGTQTVLADPKTFLVDSEQAYPLPKHPACGSDPVWTTHKGLHRIGCSLCPEFSTLLTKSIKQVVEWWTGMCEPVAGEPLTTSPESAQSCDLTSPATPTAAASAGSPDAGGTVPPEVGKRYICRNGEITGPMERRCGGTYPFTAKVGPKSVQRTWTEEGRHDVYLKGPRPYDLVAEYHEPSQPAESPDDWVMITDPKHVLRSCDEVRYAEGSWHPCRASVGATRGTQTWEEFRCRRRDLPVVPHHVTCSADRSKPHGSPGCSCPTLDGVPVTGSTCPEHGLETGDLNVPAESPSLPSPWRPMSEKPTGGWFWLTWESGDMCVYHWLDENIPRRALAWMPVEKPLHPNAAPADKPRMRQVTLREYRHTDESTAWSSSGRLVESRLTGRTCVTEVPE